ncbi:MAG: gliding motility-associated C-terminal domain-containing protein [Flavobacteriales bacterium]|nr:gliding motility-associated C-terminal domain-containing protein [Flavobacteriales bacterium]
MNIPSPLKTIALLLVFAIGLLGEAVAQNDPLIFNNGAMFYINGGPNDSAVVWVDGGVTNNDSTMINLGKFIIHGDFVNNAQSGGAGVFPLFLPGNDGLFEVYGDWVNNMFYNAGQGLVKFPTSGYVRGDSVTTFHDMELVGHIIRETQDSLGPNLTGPSVNVEIDETGRLDLDYGEFATNFDTLWVFNPATGAIIRETDCDTCGFVSSLDNGNLARATNQDASYLFPVGSSIDAPTDPNNFKRYRPVTIKPETTAADMFHVRFVNQNATNFGLPILNVDPTICYVNPWWYHRINQTGGANATSDVALYANPDEDDEDYNSMANWSLGNNVWENIGGSSGIVGGLNQVVRFAWDDFQEYQDDAYIMAFNVPPEPEVEGDTAMCASIATTYSVPENGSEYEFVVTGGTIIDETDYSVTVIWANDSLEAVIGNVQVIETIPNNINGGCASIPRSVNVEIWPLPVANFSISTDTTLPGGIFVHDILGMVDSSLLTSEWYWDFGDGTTSNDSMPYHSYYDIGTYDIQLIVRSGLECLDTLVIPVDVVEGLIVPNVFTPNNDGWNDVFDVRTSDVGAFNLIIYNRWGNVIFENASPLISWDGTNLAGTEAPAGTYFYVISKAEMNSGNAIDNELDNYNFKETGWVQLLR